MIEQARLVLPSDAFRQSFIEAVGEFQADTYPLNSGGMGKYRDLRIDDLERDFGAYLRDLEDFAAGRNLKPGFVPQTTYWLVDGDDFIGRLSVRHHLTDNLLWIGGHIGYEIRPSRRRRGYGTLALRLGLERAKALGIPKVLLTCDRTNTPSQKIIEANGGVFESEFVSPELKLAKRRYWIELC